MRKGTFAVSLLIIAALIVVAIAGCSSGSSDSGGTPSTGTTDGATDGSGGTTDPGTSDGKSLVDTKCSMCHTTDRVYSANKSRDEWVTTVDRMKTNGLVVTQEEYDAIIGFLATQ